MPLWLPWAQKDRRTWFKSLAKTNEKFRKDLVLAIKIKFKKMISRKYESVNLWNAHNLKSFSLLEHFEI